MRDSEPQLRSRAAPSPRSPRGEARQPRERRRSFFGGLFRLFVPKRASDAIAVMVAFTATVVVIVNAVALQQPKDSIAPKTEINASRIAPQTSQPPMPPKRPANTQAATPSAAPQSINSLLPPANIPNAPLRTDNPAVKARAEMIMSVQRELAQRGYYEGAIDGLPGPRTEQAIKEFEQSYGMKLTGDPTEQLLGQIRKARHRSEITGSIPRADETKDPKQSVKVLNLQKTLSRLGYGPVRFTGIHDAATRSAIERFERDRGLPVTGEANAKLNAELAQVTGSAID